MKSKMVDMRNIDQLLGEERDEICPSCGASKIWVAPIGDKWCGECGWANTDEMVDFLTALGLGAENK